jgi:membrane fusion protein, multidrug efflux system
MRRQHTFWRIGVLGAGWVLLTLGVIACRDDGPAQTPTTGQPGPPTLEVARVVQQAVDVTLSMPGELYSYEAVAIYPKVTGFVKSIRVDRGSRLRTGALIAELEAPELLAQRAEAQSKLQAAEAQLAVVRSKADADASTYDKLKAASSTPGVVAGNDLVLAQKAVEADQNQIAAAQQTVEAAWQALQAITQIEGYLRVTAPFDGVITERNVHPGALVGPNSGPGATTPMVRLAQNDRLRLVVPVTEGYVAGVRDGSMISFTVAAYPGRTFIGPVARVAHTIDVKTRTMAVELDVANRDGSLVPGTFCQVQWPIHRPEPSLFVPAGSIASTTNRTFVVRVRNGKTEWIDVRTGLTSGPLTEVFGDLRPGDTVATRGTDEIRPGTEVRIREANAVT